MKKLLSLLLALFVLFSAAACSSDTTKEEEKKDDVATETAGDDTVDVTFVSVMQGGAAWAAAEKGFYDACEELGWNGQYQAPSTPNDTMQMLDYAETAITNNADVLIGTLGIDPSVFGDVIKKAREQGIYVAGTNCFVSEDHENFWLGTDPTGMGISQAKALVEFAGDEPVTVVYMQTNATATTQNDQFAAMCDYLKDYPNITVYGQEYCDSNEVTAAEKMANLVKANPEINAAVCADGNGAIGVGNYVDENGIADEFISIGIDDGAVMLEYVLNDGLDCTIAQNFYKMGHDSVYMVKDLMEGKTVPFANDSGTVTIHKDEVKDYAAEKGIELN